MVDKSPAQVRVITVQPGLTVVVGIGDKVGRMLIDTGASLTIVAESYLPEGTWVLPLPPGLTVKSASEHEMRFLGQAKLKLELLGVEVETCFEHDCLIMRNPQDWEYQGILGNDFIVANGAVVNPASGIMRLKNVSVPLTPSSEPFTGMIKKSKYEKYVSMTPRNQASSALVRKEVRLGSLREVSKACQLSGESSESSERVAVGGGAQLELAGDSSLRSGRRAGPVGPVRFVIECSGFVREGVGSRTGLSGESEREKFHGRGVEICALHQQQRLLTKDSEVPETSQSFDKVGQRVEAEPVRPAGTAEKAAVIRSLVAKVPHSRESGRPVHAVADVVIAPQSCASILLEGPKSTVDCSTWEFNSGKFQKGVRLRETKVYLKGNEGKFPVTLENRSKCSIFVCKSEVMGHVSVTGPDEEDVPMTYQDVLPEPSEKPFEAHFGLDHLIPREREQLLKVLHNRNQVFINVTKKLGKCKIAEHEIHVEPGTKPISRPPYRVPFQFKEQYDEAIKEMLRDGIIETANGAWGAPVVLVKRQQADGSIKVRFCVDFRRLNAVTIKDSYPLPHLFEQLSLLGGRTMYTSLDLKNAFWNIPLKSEHRHYTGFCTPDGFYQFLRMPFGLCNSPPTFQRLMNTLFQDVANVACYLDDILIATDDDLELHIETIDTVLRKLLEAGLTINPTKCSWIRSETTYLGHRLTKDGAQPCPSKVQSVLNFVEPSNPSEIKSFMGILSWFRKFIPDLAKRAKPLVEMTHKDTEFVWTPERKAAFQDLKQALVTPPVLRFPDFDLEFLLFTDSSGYAIGALLAQKPNGELHPISYHSRTLTACEQKWSCTEREALAIVWAVRQNNYYLLGPRPFKVITDHLPLQFLNNLKDSTNARLVRWSLILAEYNFTVEYRPGRKNEAADALSRLKSVPGKEVPVTQGGKGLQSEAVVCGLGAEWSGYEPYWDRTVIRTEQRADTSFRKLIDSLESDPAYALHPVYALDSDGILCKLRRDGERNDRIVVPLSLRQRILSVNHDSPFSGHAGVQRTYQRLRKDFYWPKMFNDVQRYCRECVSCAQRKPDFRKHRAPLQKFPDIFEKGETYGMDIIGPLSVTEPLQNRYIITCIDLASRWLEAVAVPNIHAETTARVFVDRVVCRRGAPKYLVTDRGGQFISDLWKEVMNLLGIKHCLTTPFHPSSNGHCEKVNNTVIKCLAHFVNAAGDNWDSVLQMSVFAYNTSPHSALGWETPAFLEYGMDPRLPYPSLLARRGPVYADTPQAMIRGQILKALELAHEATTKAREEGAKQYNKRSKPINITIGDRVYLRNMAKKKGECKKWRKLFVGPYRVVDRLDETTYHIKEIYGPDSQVVHYNRLKLCSSCEDPFTATDRRNYVKTHMQDCEQVDGFPLMDDCDDDLEPQGHRMVTRSQALPLVEEYNAEYESSTDYCPSEDEEEGRGGKPQRPSRSKVLDDLNVTLPMNQSTIEEFLTSFGQFQDDLSLYEPSAPPLELSDAEGGEGVGDSCPTVATPFSEKQSTFSGESTKAHGSDDELSNDSFYLGTSNLPGLFTSEVEVAASPSVGTELEPAVEDAKEQPQLPLCSEPGCSNEVEPADGRALRPRLLKPDYREKYIAKDLPPRN